MEPSVEWVIVTRLMDVHNEITTDEAADFVENLYRYLDPYAPFAEQLEGDGTSVEKQIKWLYSLYEEFVNGDKEAAKAIWEEDEDYE